MSPADLLARCAAEVPELTWTGAAEPDLAFGLFLGGSVVLQESPDSGPAVFCAHVLTGQVRRLGAGVTVREAVQDGAAKDLLSENSWGELEAQRRLVALLGETDGE